VREWFGGTLSHADHVDGKFGRLIATILEAKQLSDWLNDNASWNHEDSQRESVELLWEIVRACDLEKIQSPLDAAKKFAQEIPAEKNR